MSINVNLRFPLSLCGGVGVVCKVEIGVVLCWGWGCDYISQLELEVGYK